MPTLSLATNTLLTRTRGGRRAAAGSARGAARELARATDRALQRQGRRARTRRPRACRAATCRSSSSAARSTRKPKLLIVSQPTWGVDVGAAAQIRGELLALRDAGCALLVVSEELDELFEICDRLVVIAQGRLSPSDRRRARPRVEQIGQWMSGLWRARADGSCADARRPRMLRLEARPQPSRAMSLASPLLALAITVAGRRRCCSSLLGKDPLRGLRVFFVEPMQERLRAVASSALKATPLLLIALGLAVCFRANVWNIGAEGPVHRRRDLRRRRRDAGRRGRPAAGSSSPVLAGRRARRHGLGGDHALLRDRFNANEILVSLMLVYVAEHAAELPGLRAVEGPAGYNFPQTDHLRASRRRCRGCSPACASTSASLIALVGVAALSGCSCSARYAGFQLAGRRPRAGGGALRRLLVARGAVDGAADLGRHGRAWPARSRWPGRSAS